MMLTANGILLKIDGARRQVLLGSQWLPLRPGLRVQADNAGKAIEYRLNDKGEIEDMIPLPQKLKDIKGKIQSMNMSVPRISMHDKGRLVHFYVPEKFFLNLKDQVKPGEFVQFSYHEEEVEINQTPYYIMASLKEDKEKKKNLSQLEGAFKEQMEELLSNRYYAFLDLEFSLSGSEYRLIKFSPEIIQAGLIVTDANGVLVEKFSAYVQPTVFKTITEKTQQFLKINKQAVTSGLTYMQFYNFIKDIMSRYNPQFLVWGVTDGFMLNSSSLLNEVKPLFEPGQPVDLQRLHRQYFEIGQDIGLYNAVKSYGENSGAQIHDAMVDALILRNIFFHFKTILEKKQDFPFKENYQKILNER